MRQVITLSITPEQAQYLKNHPEIMPSHILQSKIDEKMQAETDNVLQTNAELLRKINAIRENLERMSKFLDKKDLLDDYYKAVQEGSI